MWATLSLVSETPVTDELGFDELLERLRSVVERLEDGNVSLEDSLKSYEEGVTLARRGHEILDQAEKRIEVLVKAPNGGEGETTEALDEDGA